MSFPLIGLAQLVHYYATCKILAKDPGELREGLARTTSHSQGIVIVAAIASASTWNSFHLHRLGIHSIVSHPTFSPSFPGSVAPPNKPIPALHYLLAPYKTLSMWMKELHRPCSRYETCLKPRSNARLILPIHICLTIGISAYS